MNTLDAIAARRSIRKFKPDAIPDHVLRTILSAAIQAPSGKNRQPWRFAVVREDKRPRMLELMHEGIEQCRARGLHLGSAEHTAAVMAQAPVTVFIFNPDGIAPWEDHSTDQQYMDVVDIQSIGAAIQNMALAALELGLGSLWICDVFYACEELGEWLGEEGQLIAAMSLGVPAESPDARPRKPLDKVARWV